MKTTVIYHSSDFDGIFCREIARKFLTDAELIGWNFGDAPLQFPTQGEVYVLDLPVDRVFNLHPSHWGPIMAGETMACDPKRLVWIDHHKTSIETHPTSLTGYRIDGVAACRLAWQWFTNEFGPNNPHCHPTDYRLPEKQDFIDRRVSEPLAVRLAGEYDIWDKRDPDADTFQYALRSTPLDETSWKRMLDGEEEFVWRLLDDGRICQRYAQKIDADLVSYKSYMIQWEGLRFLVLNTGRFNSQTFAALDKPETGHDALLGYMFNGKVWTVSLYHAKHRTDLDLSTIAKLNGGGGHRGACGFTCTKLPSSFFESIPSK